MVAFLAGGGVPVFVGLTCAELTSAMPQVGGEHVYSGRALGRTASFVCTWAILLGYTSIAAFEAVALPTVLEYLLPGFSQGYLWTVAGWDVNGPWVLTGALAAIAMNILGIRTAARLQVLVVPVALVSGLGMVLGAAGSGETANVSPAFHGGFAGTLSLLVMVPFMFVDFDVIPQSAEEIDLPFADIGRLLMSSILLEIVWDAPIPLDPPPTPPRVKMAQYE
jgi:amino acid transporter